MLPEKYTDAHPLAPGKNASVFRAKNSLINREVFLKVYPIPPADTGSALREPHLLTELEHDNLAKIYGAETLEDGHILLEMELINGGSFQNVIEKAITTGVWPSTHTCIYLVSDVAAGLAHLAKRGFVHRDVKPANLVIREQGNQRQGVVTDLGLASKFDEAGRAFSSRHARIYRPPEVWANAGYSAKSDVYQLGIVFFQLLGGSLNHDLGNLDDPDLADLVVSGRLIDVSSVGPDVDSALRKVIKTATAPENERYASMSDFLVALNNAKLQQLDWVFSVTEDGFALERRSGRDTYRVEVEIEGDLHRVKRRRAGPTGVFRAKNPIAEIIHKDIGSCRKFRQIIEW